MCAHTVYVNPPTDSPRDDDLRPNKKMFVYGAVANGYVHVVVKHAGRSSFFQYQFLVEYPLPE